MFETIIGIVLIIASLFLVVAVLMQSGKGKKGLSGAITGGADDFFGKNQSTKKERALSKATTIVAIVFVVIVIVAYVFQNKFEFNVNANNSGAGVTDTADDHAGHDHE